ncbi:MAG: hypothetical protein EA397_04985 [Deltaproteobacteria bacterium]|nr:MAG: hypothetical protein EA397_04985 [Deltaproteobacteria bacterium]
MLDAEILSELLDAVADADLARKRAREVRTLRGLRGVPDGEIARVAAAAWSETPPSLADEAELSTLFGTAFEDGLIAVGLLAALLPDAPHEVFDIAQDWLHRLDDVLTADAFGWLVLGPSHLATGTPLVPAPHDAHVAVRRATVMAAMAFLPHEIEGPAAAPLRARLRSTAVRFVDEPQREALRGFLEVAIHDPDPSVRKGLRRILVAWALCDPDAAEPWIHQVRGGAPKMLREAVVKSARKGRRLASLQD